VTRLASRKHGGRRRVGRGGARRSATRFARDNYLKRAAAGCCRLPHCPALILAICGDKPPAHANLVPSRFGAQRPAATRPACNLRWRSLPFDQRLAFCLPPSCICPTPCARIDQEVHSDPTSFSRARVRCAC
jgi:hypothetical protein